MKHLITTTILCTTLSLSAAAIELPNVLTDKVNSTSTKTAVSSEAVSNDAIVSFAASQLGMSEKKVTAGLGSLFKVAKNNLSKDNFSMLSSAVPNIDRYIKQAPSDSTSAISSMFGSNDTAKTAMDISYLDSAFKTLGIPKEQLPAMLGSVTSYLDGKGYKDAAGMLKKGLSFL